MSIISDFAEKQEAYAEQMEKAVDGLHEDVKSLKDLIDAIQKSSGTVTVEDQKTLNALEVRSRKMADKLSALDALTPPTVR